VTRIAYFVHGRGKGHATRSLAVLERLRGLHHLRLFYTGDAREMLRHVPACEEIPICAPGKGMVSAFARRFWSDRKRFRHWPPNLVVSDGDGPSVNAARSLGIPVISIGHGLIFWHTHLGAELSPPQRLREALNVASSSWPAARRIAVHFAPVEPRTAGTHVARPDLRPGRGLGAMREDFILAYFRDDDGGPALEQLARRGHRVVLFGRPAQAPRGVEVHPPGVESFGEALSRCRAVVASAGGQLNAECAMLGRPMLALHRRGDAEQEMNSRLVEAAGIGIGAALERCTPEVIRRFEAELEKPRDALAARTRAMRPVSEVALRVIEELCGCTAGVRGSSEAAEGRESCL